MITKITPAQKARLGEWAEKWTAIGLSTEPANFDLAQSAALRMYEIAGLPRPAVVLRMGSPYGATLGGVLAWAMLREMFPDGEIRSQVESQVRSQVWNQFGSQVEIQVENQVWNQVWSQVRSQVWNQVGSQVGSQVWNQVRSQVRSQVESQVGRQVWSQVRSQVGSQVWSQVRSQVESQVRSQVWSQVGSQVGSQVEHQVEIQVESQVRSQVRSQVGSQLKECLYNSYHGAFWAFYGAYVSFFRDVMNWEDSVLEKFKLDEALITSCGWVWWHENVLAISDRPRVIRLDENKRLHSVDGPSIVYPDGWALWHWHGEDIQSKLEASPLAYRAACLDPTWADMAALARSVCDGE